MTDQETRQMVKEHLDEFLGTDISRGLLDMIPDKDALATKTDLEVTTKALRAEITALGGELRGEIGERRGEASLNAQTAEIVSTLTYRFWIAMVGMAILVFLGQALAILGMSI